MMKYIENLLKGLGHMAKALFELQPWGFIVAFDKFLNAVILGDPDETISARMGRWSHTDSVAQVTCKLLNIIFFWEKEDHCASSEKHGDYDDELSDHPVIGFIVLVGCLLIIVHSLDYLQGRF